MRCKPETYDSVRDWLGVASCLCLLAMLALCVTCGEPAVETYRATGEACEWGIQCDGEVCITQMQGQDYSGWKDGMCTRLCSDGVCYDQEVCVDLSDGRYCLPDCVLDSGKEVKCREGYVCHSLYGACYPDCHEFGNCPDGYECNLDGECEFQWPARVPLGQPCNLDSECDSGWCIAPTDDDGFTGWTKGVCTAPCPDGSCVDDFQCVALDGKAFCLPACGPEAPCREGYACNPQTKACLPNCQNPGWDCGDGFNCNPEGICQYNWPQLTPIGGPCDEDFDCAAGWCIEESNDEGQPTGWVDGNCMVPCGPMKACPPQSSCMVLMGNGFCLPACFGPPQSPDCREDYVCDPDFHVCLPNCHNHGWSCGPQFVCQQDGTCMSPKPPG